MLSFEDNSNNNHMVLRDQHQDSYDVVNDVIQGNQVVRVRRHSADISVSTAPAPPSKGRIKPIPYPTSLNTSSDKGSSFSDRQEEEQKKSLSTYEIEASPKSPNIPAPEIAYSRNLSPHNSSGPQLETFQETSSMDDPTP